MTSSSGGNPKPKISLLRIKNIITQLVEVIDLLSKARKVNTMTVLKRYTNITPEELEDLEIQILSDSVTKK
jgi:hypothetical protein